MHLVCDSVSQALFGAARTSYTVCILHYTGLLITGHDAFEGGPGREGGRGLADVKHELFETNERISLVCLAPIHITPGPAVLGALACILVRPVKEMKIPGWSNSLQRSVL